MRNVNVSRRVTTKSLNKMPFKGPHFISRMYIRYLYSNKLSFSTIRGISLSNHDLKGKITAYHSSSKYKSSTSHDKNTDDFNKGDSDKNGTKRRLKYLGLGGVFSLFGYYMLCDFDEHQSFCKNVTLDQPIPNMPVLGVNVFPLVKKIFKIMPDGLRRYIVIKMVSIKYSFSEP